jgi:hypothetical protein
MHTYLLLGCNRVPLVVAKHHCLKVRIIYVQPATLRAAGAAELARSLLGAVFELVCHNVRKQQIL